MRLLIVLTYFPLFSPSAIFPSYSLSTSPSNLSLYSKQDLGLQARTLAASLIASLRILAGDPRAARAISRVFSDRDNVCLSSMEEAIEAIQEGAALVEAAEGDLRTLNSRVESLLTMRKEVEVMREVSSILRALEPLLRKISPANPTSRICQSSPDRTEAYLQSLAVLMKDLSEDSQLTEDSEVERTLVQSVSVISTLTAFLGRLRTHTKEFQNFCYPDKEATVRGIRALGEIVDDLADMSAALGNIRAAVEIRRGNRITEAIVDEIQALSDLNVGYHDCSVTDLNNAAATMEDMANIIEEVGMDNLRGLLGIGNSFNLDHNRLYWTD